MWVFFNLVTRLSIAKVARPPLSFKLPIQLFAPFFCLLLLGGRATSGLCFHFDACNSCDVFTRAEITRLPVLPFFFRRQVRNEILEEFRDTAPAWRDNDKRCLGIIVIAKVLTAWSMVRVDTYLKCNFFREKFKVIYGDTVFSLCTLQIVFSLTM